MWATIIAGLEGHAHLCNSGVNVMGIPNTFRLDLKCTPYRGSHRLIYLNIPTDGIVGKGVRVVVLAEVCYWAWSLRFQSQHHAKLACLWIRCKLSITAPVPCLPVRHHAPCHDGYEFQLSGTMSLNKHFLLCVTLIMVSYHSHRRVTKMTSKFDTHTWPALGAKNIWSDRM